VVLRGVIFDLGHTLMHLDSTWPEVFEQGVEDLAAFLVGERVPVEARAFARALLEHTDQGFARAKRTMREVAATESMRATFAEFGITTPGDRLVAGAIEAFFAYEDSQWQADPDALAVLRELADRGLRLGVFSNASNDRFIQSLVDRFGFRGWLDPVLSSAGTRIRKPEPAALAQFAEAWGVAAEQMVMVGDRLEAKILGARRAGMRSVWIRARDDAHHEDASGSSPEVVVVPDATIGRPADLSASLSLFAARDHRGGTRSRSELRNGHPRGRYPQSRSDPLAP
jgi:HAD superfamily hydrolase (TIGR01509 family)